MRRILVGGLLMALIGASCGGERRPVGPSGASGKTGSVVSDAAFAKTAASSITDVDLTEWGVLPKAVAIKGPKVFLTVHNRSTTMKHEVVVTKAGATDEESAIGKTDEMPAGDSRDLAVELAAGKYQFACFIKDSNGVNHYAQGMHVDVDISS
jgi:uncharacterized cupredoxin-like copper-binding protein